MITYSSGVHTCFDNLEPGSSNNTITLYYRTYPYLLALKIKPPSNTSPIILSTCHTRNQPPSTTSPFLWTCHARNNQPTLTLIYTCLTKDKSPFTTSPSLKSTCHARNHPSYGYPLLWSRLIDLSLWHPSSCRCPPAVLGEIPVGCKEDILPVIPWLCFSMVIRV